MIRSTSNPAISPACLVACRWLSLKYAGTVMTALVIFSPRKSSAAAFSFPRIIAENVDTRVVVRPPRHLIGYAFQLIGDFVIPMPHEALDGVNRVFRIRDRLPLGHLPNQPLARLGNGHDRWSRPAALLVRDYYGLSTLHDRNNRVGRPKVNSYNLAHCSLPPSDPRPVKARYECLTRHDYKY